MGLWSISLSLVANHVVSRGCIPHKIDCEARCIFGHHMPSIFVFSCVVVVSICDMIVGFHQNAWLFVMPNFVSSNFTNAFVQCSTIKEANMSARWLVLVPSHDHSLRRTILDEATHRSRICCKRVQILHGCVRCPS